MFRMTVAALAVCLTTGCASIVSGQNQSVSVKTNNNGADVAGANCELKNDKGTWFTSTPGSVTVRRSFNDLAVTCKVEGLDAGVANVKSSTKAMAFGNILFGGVIGAGVDMSTGAAYDYPEIINVPIGKVITLAPPAAAAAPANGSTVAVRQDPAAPAKK